MTFFCIKITNNEICYQVFMRIFMRIEKKNICYLEGIWALDIFEGIVLLDIISSRNSFFLNYKANSHLENLWVFSMSKV